MFIYIRVTALVMNEIPLRKLMGLGNGSHLGVVSLQLQIDLHPKQPLKHHIHPYPIVSIHDIS